MRGHQVITIAALLVVEGLLDGVVLAAAPEEKVRLRLQFSNAECSDFNQGHVIVYRMGVYGRVCTTGWDLQDSDVVCRQLGFGPALEPVKGARGCAPGQPAPRSYHRYWLSNVQCHGNETKLSDCRHDGWGIHDCLPGQFALVRCARDTRAVRPGPPSELAAGQASKSPCPSQHISSVRLFPHRRLDKERAGYVQVRACGEWKAVCADNWGRSKAGEVACRQLGFPGVERLFWTRAPAVDRRRKAWLKNPVCTGVESFLHQCTYDELKTQACHLRRVAGVICRPKAPVVASATGSERVIAGPVPELGDLRLRGGSFPSEGRLEVFYNRTWGVVCDVGWSLKQANVACRQLGFGSAFEAPHAASRVFGRGYSLIHLDRVQCSGYERRLDRCRHSGWGKTRCDRERIASVRCHAPGASEQREEIRLEVISDDSHTPRNRRRGVIQVRDGDEWGPVCADENWNLEAGAVACRQLGYGYVYTAFTTTEGCQIEEKNMAKPDKVEVLTVMEGVEDVVAAGGFSLLHPPSEAPAPVATQKAVNVSSSDNGATDQGLATVTGLKCNGGEYSLRQCTHDSYKSRKSSCVNCKYAAVECAYVLPDLVPDVVALEHSLHDIEYRTLSSLTCAYEEGCLSSSARALMEAGPSSRDIRALLRFTVTIMNFGTADFTPVRRRESWIWHQCHHHFHSFDNFATYDILDRSGAPVAEGHKASFCLEDTHCFTGGREYYSCAAHRQGISMRCADIYGRDLDCQWIDITDLADGTYTLRVSTNPIRLAAELDYDNNVAECHMTLTTGSLEPGRIRPGTVTNVTCTASHFR